MAEQRLTDLTEKTSGFVGPDLFYMVDVSDTTDNPAGSSFRVTWQNVFNWIIGQAITFSQNIAFQALVTLQGVTEKYLVTDEDGNITGLPSIPFSGVSGFDESEYTAMLDIKSTLNTTFAGGLALVANTPTKLPQNGGTITYNKQNGQDLFDETNQRLKVDNIGERYLCEISFIARTASADTFIDIWLRGYSASNVLLFEKRRVAASLLRGSGVDTDISVLRTYYAGTTDLTAAGAGFEIWVEANNATTIWNIDTTIFHH